MVSRLHLLHVCLDCEGQAPSFSHLCNSTSLLAVNAFLPGCGSGSILLKCDAVFLHGNYHHRLHLLLAFSMIAWSLLRPYVQQA